MARNKKILLLFLCIIILLISCKTYTYDRKNPYPNMEILRYSNSQAYLFPNEGTNKLIIMIEGSGWESVLGERQDNTWLSVKYGAQFIQELNNDYTFLILEKLRRQPGMIYFEDMEDRANYTAENILAGYTDSINSYLADHVFSSVILIGTSEGALLLPLLYESMNDKGKVIAMVSISFGGLSLYESYSILRSFRTGYPSEWIEMFSDVLDTFNPENSDFPNSYEEDYYGLTYRWFNSFLHIRPFDYFTTTDISVLFIHGVADYNVPVESTTCIQENLPDKPFEYRYYQWDHQPRDYATLIRFRKDTAEWIRRVSR